MRKPGEVIEKRAYRNSIHFAGRIVCISAIERACGLSAGTASRIFSGQRSGPVPVLRKVAAVLSMGLDEFLEAIDTRVAAIKKAEKKARDQYYNRIAAEDDQDARTISTGRIAKPRMPGMRIEN